MPTNRPESSVWRLFPAFLVAAGSLIPSLLFGQGAIDKLPPEIRVKHTFGDSVQPAFEGWRMQADGTVTMWFGYYNRNSEENLNIPIGPNNKFDAPDAPAIDRQQPAFFYPGFHQFVFKVDLPKGWDKDKKLVWTLTANGVTLTANGWMAQGYEVDQGVMAMNLSPGQNTEGNEPPSVDVSGDQKVELGRPLKLKLTAKDDGIPKPRGGRSGGGIRLRWEEYRGPGEVVFDAPAGAGEYGKPAELTTEAQFSAPGVYWLRAVGFDGQLEGSKDLKVTVTAARQ
jgi:hypothetical protein